MTNYDSIRPIEMGSCPGSIPPEKHRRKPKLLIIGHARHGKDTFAELVVAKMGLSFVSSSEFVGRVAIWEQWGKERYCSFDEFFEDRVNNRAIWFNAIVAYNTPNLARTGQEMMAAHDVYVGMRNPDEFHACTDKALFDHVIWVDGSSRHPPEDKSSNGMTKEMANIWIDNNGPEENLHLAVGNLQRRLHDEGFDVDWSPLPNAMTEEQTAFVMAQMALDDPFEKVEPGLYSKEMEKIWHQDDDNLATDTEHHDLVVGDHPDPCDRPHLENPATPATENMDGWIGLPFADKDPCDPPVQRPLIINNNKPTLNEYMGIINAPMVPDNETPLGGREKAWNDISNGEVKCNGDCGCEDGSLCHENVCGPISKMVVNPTLEESRKFHNDALMATCNPPQIGTAAVVARSKPIAKDDPVFFHPKNIPLITKPESSIKPLLDWKDMPEGATKVLDHGFFKVIGVMGTDQAIVDAARMSYGRGTKTKNTSEGLIHYLVRNGHTSPLEMCEIKFHIRMPIFVMRQWVRHRTANLNEYSGRYSEMVRLFYVPEVKQICLQNKMNKQGSAEPLPINEAELVQRTIRGVSDEAFAEYETLLDMGVSRETARIVLPLNTYTEVVWKLDVSNLIKFLRLRDDDHAQWEIRQYAMRVSAAVQDHFPLVFAAYEEMREAENFTILEIEALITGNYDDLSASQTKKIADLRDAVV